jgi:hypothetical protein
MEVSRCGDVCTVEEDPCRYRVVEVPHHRGVASGRRRTRATIAPWRSHTVEVSRRGGVAPGRRRTQAAIMSWRSCAQVASWRSHTMEKEDLRRRRAVEEDPHHG